MLIVKSCIPYAKYEKNLLIMAVSLLFMTLDLQHWTLDHTQVAFLMGKSIRLFLSNIGIK